jgi:hypothetical protein
MSLFNWWAVTIDLRRSHDASFVEARAALPLDGGVKCRQPERVEDGWNRSVPEGWKPRVKRIN